MQARCWQFVNFFPFLLNLSPSGKYQSARLVVCIRMNVGNVCFSLHLQISLLPGSFPCYNMYSVCRVRTIQDTHVLITAHPHWLCCHGPSRGFWGCECGDEPASPPPPPCAGCHVDLAGTEQQWHHISIFTFYTFNRWSHPEWLWMCAAVEWHESHRKCEKKKKRERETPRGNNRQSYT